VVLEYSRRPAAWTVGNLDGVCTTPLPGGGYSSSGYRLFGFTDDGGKPRVRSKLLDRISVMANPDTTCSASAEKVVSGYTFAYTADLDTQMPRLAAVDRFGTEGASGARLPVGRYTYGRVVDWTQIAYFKD